MGQVLLPRGAALAAAGEFGLPDRRARRRIRVWFPGLRAREGSRLVGFQENKEAFLPAGLLIRAALVDNLQVILKTILSLMQEDSTLPNLPTPTSARCWVEHRSKIGRYSTIAKAVLGIAGCLDSIRVGKVAETEARLATGDTAIATGSDRGRSWLMDARVRIESRTAGACLFIQGFQTPAGQK